jgi:hypothetical protein
MNRIIKIVPLAAIAALATAAVASANVAVDNGSGSVSKGDVQSALGWNNHDFDANSKNVVFSVKQTQVSRMAYSCAGQDFVMETTQSLTKKVNAAYTYNNDRHTQITGWNLTGASGSSTANGPVSVTGADAQQQWNACEVATNGSVNYGDIDWSKWGSTTTTIPNSLMVSDGINPAVALPNTPTV